ncbi:hypothetical protein ACOAJ8_11300 [Arcobacter cryaerophilus gv. pseudocryaerophilus]
MKYIFKNSSLFETFLNSIFEIEFDRYSFGINTILFSISCSLKNSSIPSFLSL